MNFQMMTITHKLKKKRGSQKKPVSSLSSQIITDEFDADPIEAPNNDDNYPTKDGSEDDNDFNNGHNEDDNYSPPSQSPI